MISAMRARKNISKKSSAGTDSRNQNLWLAVTMPILDKSSKKYNDPKMRNMSCVTPTTLKSTILNSRRMSVLIFICFAERLGSDMPNQNLSNSGRAALRHCL